MVPSTTVRYVAELAHVREVSLLGTADLGFWKNRLTEESLVCADEHGRAQLVIVASQARYLGLSFTELSFSVRVSRSAYGRRQDGVFLVRAFNSRRAFAFCERALFRTPYDHGDVRVSTDLPAQLSLVRDDKAVFRAAMHADASGSRREPARCAQESFEGPVFLPSARRDRSRVDGDGPRSAVFEPSIQPGPHHPGKLFFAVLRGLTETYPFVEGQDSLAIEPSPDVPILQALVDSHFRPSEWVIRADATHAKSRTYSRAAAFPDPSRP